MLDRKRLFERGAQCELARRDFFEYCHLKAPDFYKRNRAFLVNFCGDLQEFYQSDESVLIVNMPPRHGKSRTASCFVEWILGKDQTQKIMTGSYNEMLSTNFSKSIRNTIAQVKADENRIVYSDIFPNVRIKRGDGAMNMWGLENGYNNYLATSPTGTATGFGASVLIIDDLIKSAYEANNADVLDKHFLWFANTMLSRLEENAKIIIVMTRWHSEDLAGRVLEHYEHVGDRVKHVLYKAVQDDGTMLCPEILSEKSYANKIKAMGADIASANYQQEPIDIKGRFYAKFLTYDDVPRDKTGHALFTEIRNYTDTADTGEDYLCSINYGVYNREAYILNVIYSKEPMEITEPAVAKMLFHDNVNLAQIESNNGGRGFARAVERLLLERFKSNRTAVKWFHQAKNKAARILSNATWIMEHVYFPANWRDRFPEFHNALMKYQREGKNAHDDAPDCLTGVAEMVGITREKIYSFD